MINKNYPLALMLLSCFIFGCSSGDDDSAPSAPTLFIVNEGNFQAANGSISGYNDETGIATPEVMGADATIQNIRVSGSGLFMVTNAPDRLDVLNSSFNVSISVTEGLDNPIDVAVDGNDAYVTNWGDINTAFGEDPDSYIAIVDLTSGTVVDSILLDVRPQDVMLANNQLFVTHESATFMTVIEVSTLAMTIVDTPFGPSEMVQDSDGHIWVLSTGGSLFEVDPSDQSITNTLSDLVVGGFNEKMAIDNVNDVIYFLGGSNDSFTGLTNVFAVDLSAGALSAEVLVSDGFAFYGIGVNEATGDIYVGDSNAFQSTGTGLRYGSDGTLLADFATGIGPSGFLFAR